jgi:hypothetical protein
VGIYTLIIAKTLINTPIQGVFLYLIATAKATSRGPENTHKRHSPSRASKHPIFSIRETARGTVRGTLFSYFLGSKLGYTLFLVQPMGFFVE